MDNDATYYTSKFIKKFCTKVELLCIIWLVQSPDLNLIKNLRRIIKIRVSGYYHRIYSIEKMKITISKEWEKLTEEDYRKYIESIHQ